MIKTTWGNSLMQVWSVDGNEGYDRREQSRRDAAATQSSRKS